MNFALVFQVVAFLINNKTAIRELILSIESLIPDAPGASKAGAVKSFIGQALNIGDTIDAAWPVVSPIFNLLVAQVKAVQAPSAAS